MGGLVKGIVATVFGILAIISTRFVNYESNLLFFLWMAISLSLSVIVIYFGIQARKSNAKILGTAGLFLGLLILFAVGSIGAGLLLIQITKLFSAFSV